MIAIVGFTTNICIVKGSGLSKCTFGSLCFRGAIAVLRILLDHREGKPLSSRKRKEKEVHKESWTARSALLFAVNRTSHSGRLFAVSGKRWRPVCRQPKDHALLKINAYLTSFLGRFISKIRSIYYSSLCLHAQRYDFDISARNISLKFKNAVITRNAPHGTRDRYS